METWLPLIRWSVFWRKREKTDPLKRPKLINFVEESEKSAAKTSGTSTIQLCHLTQAAFSSDCVITIIPAAIEIELYIRFVVTWTLEGHLVTAAVGRNLIINTPYQTAFNEQLLIRPNLETSQINMIQVFKQQLSKGNQSTIQYRRLDFTYLRFKYRYSFCMKSLLSPI